MKLSKLFALTMLSTSLLFTACGDDEEDHHDEGPEAEGCEHREEGPFEFATAAAAADDAPLVELEHHDVTVTLAQDGTSYSGFIDFASDEEGEFRLFLNTDVTVRLWDDAGSAVTFEESTTTIEECPDLIAAYHLVDLEVGTYTLEFVTTSESTVHVVLAPASGEHHDDHDE